MNRLTEKQSEEYDLKVLKEKLCNEYCEGQYLVTCEGCGIYQAMQKLAFYEDKEEEGTLQILPIKVGGFVYTNHSMSGWYMRKKDRPYKGKVVFIGLNDSDPIFNITFDEGKMLQFNFSDIGKTVFLSEKDATNKLRVEEKE